MGFFDNLARNLLPSRNQNRPDLKLVSKLKPPKLKRDADPRERLATVVDFLSLVTDEIQKNQQLGLPTHFRQDTLDFIESHTSVNRGVVTDPNRALPALLSEQTRLNQTLIATPPQVETKPDLPPTPSDKPMLDKLATDQYLLTQRLNQALPLLKNILINNSSDPDTVKLILDDPAVTQHLKNTLFEHLATRNLNSVSDFNTAVFKALSSAAHYPPIAAAIDLSTQQTQATSTEPLSEQEARDQALHKLADQFSSSSKTQELIKVSDELSDEAESLGTKRVLYAQFTEHVSSDQAQQIIYQLDELIVTGSGNNIVLNRAKQNLPNLSESVLHAVNAYTNNTRHALVEETGFNPIENPELTKAAWIAFKRTALLEDHSGQKPSATAWFTAVYGNKADVTSSLTTRSRSLNFLMTGVGQVQTANWQSSYTHIARTEVPFFDTSQFSPYADNQDIQTSKRILGFAAKKIGGKIFKKFAVWGATKLAGAAVGGPVGLAIAAGLEFLNSEQFKEVKRKARQYLYLAAAVAAAALAALIALLIALYKLIAAALQYLSYLAPVFGFVVGGPIGFVFGTGVFLAANWGSISSFLSGAGKAAIGAAKVGSSIALNTAKSAANWAGGKLGSLANSVGLGVEISLPTGAVVGSTTVGVGVLTYTTAAMVGAGSFLTPVSEVQTAGVSNYLILKKLVNGTEKIHFENDAGQKTLTYEITLKPQPDTIIVSVDSVEDIFNYVSEDPRNIPTSPLTAEDFSPNDNGGFNATYSIDINTADYQDTAITNTLTVVATIDSQGTSGQDIVTNFATVEIGEPVVGVGCYAFDNTFNSTQITKLTRAIQEIFTTPNAQALTCKGGTITMSFRPADVKYGGWVRGQSLWLNQLGINSAPYTMSHETSHYMLMHSPWIRTLYRDMGVISEGYLRSYPGTKSEDEDIAESLGLYLLLPQQYTAPSDQPHRTIRDFANEYPLHFQFASRVFSQQQ